MVQRRRVPTSKAFRKGGWHDENLRESNRPSLLRRLSNYVKKGFRSRRSAQKSAERWADIRGNWLLRNVKPRQKLSFLQSPITSRKVKDPIITVLADSSDFSNANSALLGGPEMSSNNGRATRPAQKVSARAKDFLTRQQQSIIDHVNRIRKSNKQKGLLGGRSRVAQIVRSKRREHR